MAGLEFAAIKLGTAVAKAACGIWLGNRVAEAVSGSLIDLAAERYKNHRDQRQFRRVRTLAGRTATACPPTPPRCTTCCCGSAART